MQIVIRQGLSNLSQAAEIRREVFIEEQKFSNEFDETDQTAWHALLLISGQAAATARAFPDPQDPRTYHIGRVAVRKQYRGQKLGQKVMEALEEKLSDLGANTITLSAQVRVQGFYEALGYHAQGEPYFDEYCPHICMIKQLIKREG